MMDGLAGPLLFGAAFTVFVLALLAAAIRLGLRDGSSGRRPRPGSRKTDNA